jgi:hypothetical protein
MPSRQSWMLTEVSAQTGLVTRIDQVDGAAKDLILNTLVMRQVQSIGGDWPFDSSFETGPTGKSAFAGDGEVRVAELEFGSKNCLIRGSGKAGMEFPNQLRRAQAARSVGLD